SDVRLNYRSALHDVTALSQRANQSGECSSSDEKHEEPDEDPRHTAEATFLFRHRGGVGDRRTAGVRTSCIGTGTSSQSESAIPAKAQLRRHRRMAVRTDRFGNLRHSGSTFLDSKRRIHGQVLYAK